MASIRFTTEEQVIEALSMLPAHYDPMTSSLLRVPKAHGDPHSTLFRPGFLAGFEERAEVIRRLRWNYTYKVFAPAAAMCSDYVSVNFP